MSYLKSQNEEGAAVESSARLFSLEVPGVPRPSRRMKWMRAGLSVLIGYHLLCVLLGPMSDSLVGIKLGPIVTPYLYFFEMTNAWNFFSPNPEPPIYIEYELVDSKGETILHSKWPAETSPFFLRERQNRRITSTDFMIASELKVEKMMVPYLCHQEPRAISVRLWRVMYSFPAIAEVESGKRKLGDDVGVDRRFVANAYCEGAAG